ncbi:MAG: histidine phosphatase family protein [Cyanobacteria bacterium J06639_1]
MSALFTCSHPTRVILIRHARSTFNQMGRYQGSSDEAVLTEAGLEAARKTGREIASLGIDAIYTSRLTRVRQTTAEMLTEIAAVRHALPELIEDDRLREIDLHAWQGLTYTEVRQRYATDYRCWVERPHEFQVLAQPEPSGSAIATLAPSNSADSTFARRPVLDLYARVERFWPDLLARHAGKTVAIVSHSGTIRAAIGTALGIPPARFHLLQQSNCGISQLAFAPNSSIAQLETLNLTEHLGETLPKTKEGKQGVRLLLVAAKTVDDAQAIALSRRWRDIDLDFCLSEAGAAAWTAHRVLADRPATTRYFYDSADRPDWDRTLDRQRDLAAKSGRFLTGAIVASEAYVRDRLSRYFGSSASVWQPHPGAFSVLHHPHADRLPSIQALNIPTY